MVFIKYRPQAGVVSNNLCEHVLWVGLLRLSSCIEYLRRGAAVLHAALVKAIEIHKVIDVVEDY